MHPILFSIGPLTIHAYGVFIALAFVAGMLWAKHEARQRGLDHKLVVDIGLAVLIGAIVGARLLYVLLSPGYYLEHPLEILMFWNGGLVFSGGVVLGGLFGWLVGKKHHAPVLPWLDCAAPALALGMAIGRVGCFFAGCCYGQLCYEPWAVVFTDPNTLASPLGLPLHPTQLYHMLAGIFTFTILIFAKQRLTKPGALMGLFLMLFAALRFTIEFFRADYRGQFGVFSVTQLMAMGFFVLGLLLILRKQKGDVS